MASKEEFDGPCVVSSVWHVSWPSDASVVSPSMSFPLVPCVAPSTARGDERWADLKLTGRGVTATAAATCEVLAGSISGLASSGNASAPGASVCVLADTKSRKVGSASVAAKFPYRYSVVVH